MCSSDFLFVIVSGERIPGPPRIMVHTVSFSRTVAFSFTHGGRQGKARGTSANKHHTQFYFVFFSFSWVRALRKASFGYHSVVMWAVYMGVNIGGEVW